MDIVICPGCGKDVPHNNNGCPHCGYENGWIGADFRLMTLRELLAAPSFPECGAMEMNQVCPAFLRRLAEEVLKAHNANLSGLSPGKD